MRVHSSDAEATKLREGSVLTCGEVADGVVRDIRETPFTFFSAEDEEAVAGGPELEAWLAERGEGREHDDAGEDGAEVVAGGVEA